MSCEVDWSDNDALDALVYNENFVPNLQKVIREYQTKIDLEKAQKRLKLEQEQEQVITYVKSNLIDLINSNLDIPLPPKMNNDLLKFLKFLKLKEDIVVQKRVSKQ
jgi:hypothetical protein